MVKSLIKRITYQSIHLIQFPIYPINSDNLDWTDGLVYLDGDILDDTNQLGKTLGQRRLQTPFMGLYTLKNMGRDYLSLLHGRTGQYYIDNLGTIFFYEKTRFAKIQPCKIIEVQLKDTYTAIKVAKVNSLVVVPRAPRQEHKWANMLFIDNLPWKIHSFSEEKDKARRIKI